MKQLQNFRYSFYDGPPFATGLPHYGHILAGTIKDVVTRYAYSQGYHVERRFGWDCHGLPVEFEIDKALGIKGKEDVLKMGIPAYNAECRKIVMRYANEWEQIIGRMGRWIDFKNDYKTLYPWYMESIWWVFKQLYTKGLVYQGVKVMPYSTACTTSLSNFESGQNYKEVVDPCVVVSFKVIGDKDNASIIAWTTTPWTLPSNMALCVNPELNYVRVKEKSTGSIYILMENRIEYVFKSLGNVEVLSKFLGKTLKDLHYEPLFNYYAEYKEKTNAFRVLCDSYVTEESGTGVVHQAPYFGEDDYRVCLAAGVIKRDMEIVCPVDESGRFFDRVSDFKGQHVKDADKHIIAALKKNGRLVSSGQTKHSYPFCWRSDTPLIYKAVPSWFIRVEHMSKNLLACSSKTYWVPEFVKEKRFGNWLRDARDWAVSRNRYWGTPIPIWMSPTGDEVVCIGSIDELEQLSGVRVTDLHRESIDDIEIPSAKGGPPLRRIQEVFDCWFESGSMPYAQNHFPFENAAEFQSTFPADFIAEGIDQTRGWFYTLLVISTALFNKPPFKNLIANGLVLASDGQKMSKRKKNYPDPMDVVHKFGADALRLYLINSPVVRAENLRFKEEGVRDIIKDVFLPWYNALRFLLQNIHRYEKDEKEVYYYDEIRHHMRPSKNVMDIWITSFKESLLEFIACEMKAYRLYTVVPRLTKFIDQLTNWYVRMNRRRIKGESGLEECIASLDTLYDVLIYMVKMMSPFTPFLTEFMYQRLRLLDFKTAKEKGSVHYLMMPVSNKSLINLDIERAVSRMQAVVELGRVMRDRKTVPVKYPLPEVIVIQKAEYLDDIKSLEQFILGELNVRKLTLSSDKQKYGVTMRAEPDHKVLGLRLKNDFKDVTLAIKKLTDAEIETAMKVGRLTVCGHEIEIGEIRVIFQFDSVSGGGTTSQYEAHSDNEVLVLMDMTPNEELMEEGTAREIINRVQKLKKKAQLIPTDIVTVYYAANDAAIIKVAKSHHDFIQTAIKSNFVAYTLEETKNKNIIIEEIQELKGVEFKLYIADSKIVQLPVDPWCNVLLKMAGADTLRYGARSGEATILLKSQTGKMIELVQFRHEVELLFGLYQRTYGLFTTDGKEISKITDSLNKSLVVVAETKDFGKFDVLPKVPFVKFVNIEHKTKTATLLVENPRGHVNFDQSKLELVLKGTGATVRK